MDVSSAITDATTIIGSVWTGITSLMSEPIIAIGFSLVFVSAGISLFKFCVNRAKS